MSETRLQPEQTTRDTPASVPTFFVWGALQLGALALAWANLRVTAQGTPLTGALALKIMLIAQIAGACLLFPGMLVGPRPAILCAAMAFPTLQLASHLAGTGPVAGLKAFVLVVLWIAGLTCWNVALIRHRLTLQAILNLWVFGSVILLYLIMEFRPRPALAELIWDSAPLVMAGQFSEPTRLPGLLLVNLVLAFATLAGVRKWGRPAAQRY